MLVFVATASAGAAQIGWPCQRLNWGWRNVWSTCSINSYSPHSTVQDPNNNVGFHTAGPNTIILPWFSVPTFALNPNGVFSPTTTTGIPAFLCANAGNTGSGLTANLRNRCRRAIDAYGGLVKSCQQAPQLTGVRLNTLAALPDFLPQAGHGPHTNNVQFLGTNAAQCLLPAVGGGAVPANLATPSNTCPGLLGWFTVVYNACGFSWAPGLNAVGTQVAHMPLYVPLATPTNGASLVITGLAQGVGTFSPSIIGSTAVQLTTTTRVGTFCGPTTAGAVGPWAWNDAPTGSTVFRTSRCRKALDQFGRTANRCHNSLSTTAAGPAQAGGYFDPLRFLAVGAVPNQVPAAPTGINVWAPFCN